MLDSVETLSNLSTRKKGLTENSTKSSKDREKISAKATYGEPGNLFRAAGKLKQIRRAGWVRKAGIEHAESVADHSFRAAILAAYFAKVKNLDSGKLVRMLLVHDIAESEIGDLMPEEKVSEKDHRQLEDKIARYIFDMLPKEPRRMFLRDWKEMLAVKTPEAKLAWQIDKLEMGLTMQDYLSEGQSKKKLLKEFDPSRLLSRDLRKVLKDYGRELQNK